MLGHALTVLAIFAVAATLLFWPRLASRWRRRLAVLSSASGIVVLVLGMRAEGFRESPTTAVFLVGTPYVIETASASAGLPYYVATGALLLLGLVGLAIGERDAAFLARHWLLSAVALSLLVTALRFLLEKAAAPAAWTHAVGVTWLAPAAGAYFAMCVKQERRGLRALLSSLVLYALAARGAVAALMVVATTLRAGSHYDVSPLTVVQNPFTGRAYSFAAASLEQIVTVALVPQLVVWPIYTVLAGLTGAAVAHAIASAWRRPQLSSVTQVAPVGQD
jgi:hypothetical protein